MKFLRNLIFAVALSLGVSTIHATQSVGMFGKTIPQAPVAVNGGLLYQSDFTYLGAFQLPSGSFGSPADTFNFAPNQLTFYQDPSNGASLFIYGASADVSAPAKASIAQVKIPGTLADPASVGEAGLPAATTIQGFGDFSGGAAGTSVPSGGGWQALTVYNNKLIGTIAYSFGCTQTSVAWVSGLSLASLGATGPYAFTGQGSASTLSQRMMGGNYLIPIPLAYQGTLGGKLLSGSGYMSIASCSEVPAGLFVVDADTLATQPATNTTITATPLAWYLSGTHSPLGYWDNNSIGQAKVENNEATDVSGMTTVGSTATLASNGLTIVTIDIRGIAADGSDTISFGCSTNGGVSYSPLTMTPYYGFGTTGTSTTVGDLFTATNPGCDHVQAKLTAKGSGIGAAVLIEGNAAGVTVPSIAVTDPHGAKTCTGTNCTKYPYSSAPYTGTYTVPYQDGSTRSHGAIWPDNTRSVLVFGMKGLGSYCYGTGTSDGNLAGTDDGTGAGLCYDPTYLSTHGDHAWPYTAFVWAYDANDLAAVKAGTKNAWDVVPYTGWAFSTWHDDLNSQQVGVAWDPNTRRAYVGRLVTGTGDMIVFVYSVGNGS